MIFQNDLIIMAKADKYFPVKLFLEDYIAQLEEKLDLLEAAIVTQALSCPQTMELASIESKLTEYVRLHHVDLKRKMNFRINHFKKEVEEKEFFEYLSSSSLTVEQVILYLI